MVLKSCSFLVHLRHIHMVFTCCQQFWITLIECWVYKLQDYQYNLIHTTGKTNSEADILSRWIPYTYVCMISTQWIVTIHSSLRPGLLAIAFASLFLSKISMMWMYVHQICHNCNHSRNYCFSGQTLFQKRSGWWVHVPTLAECYDILKEAHDGHGQFGKCATFQYIHTLTNYTGGQTCIWTVPIMLIHVCLASNLIKGLSTMLHNSACFWHACLHGSQLTPLIKIAVFKR
jgi:hypothetical protein